MVYMFTGKHVICQENRKTGCVVIVECFVWVLEKWGLGYTRYLRPALAPLPLVSLYPPPLPPSYLFTGHHV